MKIIDLIPTTLDITLSTFDGDLDDANTVFVGIPCYMKTRAYTPYVKNTDILRILHNNVEDNSFICPDVYYSMLKLVDIGDIIQCDYTKAGEDITTLLTLKNVKDKNFIFLGGEHTYTYFIVDTVKPENLIVLDAHLDLKDSFMFDKFNHTTYLRRLLEKYTNINVYLIGVRSYDESERIYLESLDNVEVINAENIEEIQLKGRSHLSIDLDVLDITNFSSTTYPEPKGLTFPDMLRIISKVISNTDVKTIDVMEFNPLISRLQDAILVTRLIYELGTMLEYKKCI